MTVRYGMCEWDGRWALWVVVGSRYLELGTYPTKEAAEQRGKEAVSNLEKEFYNEKMGEPH